MKKIKLPNSICLALYFFWGISALHAQQLAFPGAEGFGAYTTGGRGGTVVHVTNLNESGPGSFADAVSQSNRMVVFDVGGVIPNNGIISVASNITIAGQTAPGGGITIYGNRLVFNGSNIIMRFIRVRGSIRMPDGKTTLTVDNLNNIMLDHCSISWGRWDNVHIVGSTNVTFQYCIVAEGIDPQRFGAITDGTRNWTVSHCLWTNNTSRNPKMKCFLQYINNIVYNYGNGIIGGHSAADNYQDVINNYFIAGPSASGANYLSDWTATDHLYSSGNYTDLNKDGVLNGTLMTDYNGATVMSSPFLTSPVPVTTQSAADAYTTVMNDVGASIIRDSVDTRLINQLSSLGKLGAIIHSDVDVKGPGFVANGVPPLDTDRDGMSDVWELSKGLNPNSATDANGDRDGDGYTNIEEYINYLANTANIFRTPNLTATSISKTEIDLSWSIASNLHTGFIIERSLDNTSWVPLADVSATVNSYKDLGLIQNTKYYYRIKAYNATQSSDYSAVFAFTQSDSPVSPTPFNQTTNLDTVKIVFKWNASASVTSYNFYCGTSPANLTQAATGLTAKTFTLKNLLGKTTYYWRVDAVTPDGIFPSNVWSFKTRRLYPLGLTAWYKLDETSDVQIFDSSVYQNNGFLIDIDSTARQRGLFNNCINSINDDIAGHIEIPHSDPLYVDKGIFDISLWMKCAPQNAVLFEKLGPDAGGTTKGYTVELTTTQLKLTLVSGGTTLVTTTTLPGDFFNRWNNVIITRDTAIKRIRTFINGTMVGNLATTTNLDIGNTASVFVANNSALAKPYQGLMDDIRFYNQSFFSNNMVNIIYNAYPAPDKAQYIFPVNYDSCFDHRNIQLAWRAGPNAFSATYNIYVGTDPANLQLKLSNVTATKNVVIPGTLNYNTKYYWRVDSKNSKGAATGDVWTFKTKKLLPMGVVGNWELDETTGIIAADSSIYRNNGTIKKLTGNPIHEPGHILNSLNLSNGRDSSHVFVPAANQLYFSNNPFSISLWMKVASAPTASSYLIHKGSFVNDTTKRTNGKWYGLEIKGANFAFSVDDDVIKTSLSTTSAPFCNGQWVHVVAIRDTITKKLFLYRNGILVNSIADGTGSIGNPENLLLANVRDLTAPYFGSIDQVKLYNYAISPVEILALYNEDPRTGKPINLYPVTNTITAGLDTATIAWTGDSYARWYNVYAGTDSANLALVAGKITGTKYLLTQLAPGIKYFWRVEAGNNTYKVAGDIWNFKTSQIPQSITFSLPTDKTYGDAPFVLSATGGASGNPIIFRIVSGDAIMLTGDTDTAIIVKAGTVQIKSSQAANVAYSAAPDVVQTITIAKKAQFIIFNALANKTYGDVPFALDATSTSGLPVSYISSDTTVATMQGSTVTIVDAGSANITARQAGDGNYLEAVDVSQSLTINQATQSITFGTLGTTTYGRPPIILSATSSSGLPVSYSSSDTTVAVVRGNTLTIAGVGTVVITASQAGDRNFSPASVASQSLTVNQANQTITFAALNPVTYGKAPFGLTATASSGLPVSYTSSNASVASVNGNKITVLGAGTTVITVSQAGNANYSAAGSVFQILTVNKAMLTVYVRDTARVVGITNPAFVIHYSGFVSADNSAVIHTKPLASCAARRFSPVGTYPITVAGGIDNNYSFTYVGANLYVLILAPGTYSFRSVRSGLCVQVGSPITQKNCNSTASQKWQLKNVGTNYEFYSVASQQYLYCPTVVKLAALSLTTGTANRQFKITSAEDGAYSIMPVSNASLAIDISGNSKRSGATLILNTKGTASSQQFMFGGCGEEDRDEDADRISVPEVQGNFLTVYPNPLEGSSLTIQFALKSRSEVRVEIIDLMGNVILRRNLGTFEAGEISKILDLWPIVKGSYIIVIQTNDGPKTAKLICFN